MAGWRKSRFFSTHFAYLRAQGSFNSVCKLKVKEYYYLHGNVIRLRILLLLFGYFIASISSGDWAVHVLYIRILYGHSFKVYPWSVPFLPLSFPLRSWSIVNWNWWLCAVNFNQEAIKQVDKKKKFKAHFGKLSISIGKNLKFKPSIYSEYKYQLYKSRKEKFR